MGAPDHRAAAEAIRAVPYAVLTVSDSRNEESDTSGRLIRQLFDEAGHTLTNYELVRNAPGQIQAAVRRFLQGPALCLVATGGTGAGRRDLTVETVSPLLDKLLPGFGELFRVREAGENRDEERTDGGEAVHVERLLQHRILEDEVAGVEDIAHGHDIGRGARGEKRRSRIRRSAGRKAVCRHPAGAVDSGSAKDESPR